MISATSNEHNENKVLNTAERFFVYRTFDNPAIKQGSDYCSNHLKKKSSPAEFLFWL